VLAKGKIGAVVALRQVRRMIYEEKLEHVMIVGVDSLISTPVLSVFEEKGRLLTSRNSNGFIPGEAAAAVLISTPKTKSEPELICRGLGFGMESATIDSDLPLRADGLVQALRESMAEAACTMGDLDFCITDASGEQYYFKEASLALLRTLRDRKDEFDMWHPADCIGEVGAAIGPVIFAVAMYAMQKGYAPGHHILCHFSNDDGRRAAVILSYQQVEHL
jgi:3-oxoacyl-[acyl-carrier-protein] synthase-1